MFSPLDFFGCRLRECAAIHALRDTKIASKTTHPKAHQLIRFPMVETADVEPCSVLKLEFVNVHT